MISAYTFQQQNQVVQMIIYSTGGEAKYGIFCIDYICLIGALYLTEIFELKFSCGFLFLKIYTAHQG